VSDARSSRSIGHALRSVGYALREYFGAFGTLRECGREFWVVQLVNLLDGIAYFATLTVATLYLSETLGYSDKEAGWLWALVTAAYTATGIVAGFIGDSFGIKRTLYLSVIMLIVARLTISLSLDRIIIIPALFAFSIGTAIMTPILISATKRYTTKKSQAAGFNLLYFLMNIGAFLGNATLDPLRDLQWGNRSVFMAGSAISILCFLAILFLWRKPLDVVDAGVRAPSSDDKDNATSSSGSSSGKFSEKWEAPWTIALSVIRESAFWRFMLFLVVLTGVRLVFEHQSQVYPKYYTRTMSSFLFESERLTNEVLDEGTIPDSLRAAFAARDLELRDDATIKREFEDIEQWLIKSGGARYVVAARADVLRIYESDVPVGALNAINPLIICFGVILSTPIVARFKLFNVMMFGITISALSMVVLAIDPRWLVGVFGGSLARNYGVIVIIQIVAFSVGEMIWSPRLYEYTAAIAPVGREASYMGLSYLPQMFARLLEGPLAGFMLTHYCPPDVTDRLETVPYAQSPQMMSLILAVIALSSPILVVLLRGVIQKEGRVTEAERA